MSCRSVVLPGLAGLALLTAGCGAPKPRSVASLGSTSIGATTPSGPGSTASGGTDGPPSSPREIQALLAFSTCMRAHGEPGFPDPLPGGGYPRTGGSGIDQLDPKSPRFTSAMSDCRSEAVASGVIHTPAERQAHLAQLDAEDACIRKHGVPGMPDANADGVQPAPPQPVGSARMQAAERACAYLNP